MNSLNLNRIYVVQYSEILGGAIELGGIHYQIYTTMDEVEKNGYTCVDNGDGSMMYEREGWGILSFWLC